MTDSERWGGINGAEIVVTDETIEELDAELEAEDTGVHEILRVEFEALRRRQEKTDALIDHHLARVKRCLDCDGPDPTG